MYHKDLLEFLKSEGLYREAEKAKKHLDRVLTDSLDAKTEKVLIITDKGIENRRIAPILGAGYYLAAKESGLEPQLILQSIKTTAEPADPQVDDAIFSLGEKSIIIMPVSNKLGETPQVGKSFRGFMNKKQHRFITAPSLGSVETDKLHYFLNAINIDYDALHKKQKPIKDLLDNAKEIRVTSPGGSDFTVNIKGMTSISNDGNYKTPCCGGNLPTGEVYLPPAKEGVDGTIVVDVSSRNKESTVVLREPIILEVKKSRVLSIEGGKGAHLLDESLSWGESNAKYPERIRLIGEFGIGMNPNAKIIGAMIIDEKVIGTAHVAIGSNYWFGGDIRTIVHYDQVFKDPKIWIDGKELKL